MVRTAPVYPAPSKKLHCLTQPRPDRLVDNPYAQPPAALDWDVGPTYPVRHVPYYLAPLWDAGLAAHSAERKAKAAAAAKATATAKAKAQTQAGVVPKELRAKLKRARGARSLLMALESQVRRFVERWEDEREWRAQHADVPLDPDSEDDDLVSCVTTVVADPGECSGQADGLGRLVCTRSRNLRTVLQAR